MVLLIGADIAVDCWRRWTGPQAQRSFDTALEGVNLLRVSTTADYKGEPATLGEITETKAIKELFQNIKFAPLVPGARCACHGDIIFEFCREGNMVLRFSFHGKRNIRWEQWPSDIKLTKQSAAYLVRWISANVHNKEFLREFNYDANDS